MLAIAVKARAEIAIANTVFVGGVSVTLVDASEVIVVGVPVAEAYALVAYVGEVYVSAVPVG